MMPELNSDGWDDIEKSVASLQEHMDDKSLKEVLRNIGKATKKKVRQFAPEKSREPSYSDFDRGSYKHIKDDIKYTVKKSSTGQLYVSVKGGKATGYKWHWVNEGHIAQNGNLIPGTHFVDKAEAASAQEINQCIDDFMKGLTKNDG